MAPRQISSAAGIALDILRDNAIAMCQYGSALMGALHVHSDLDLFVVVDPSGRPIGMS